MTDRVPGQAGQSPSQKTTDEKSRGQTDCCQPARARTKGAIAVVLDRSMCGRLLPCSSLKIMITAGCQASIVGFIRVRPYLELLPRIICPFSGCNNGSVVRPFLQLHAVLNPSAYSSKIAAMPALPTHHHPTRRLSPKVGILKSTWPFAPASP
uniref:Uncharacterized protein n=1 Tax=Panagrellus redivivus TaxID=6233 RepID=A0A7E4UP32_PANRE